MSQNRPSLTTQNVPPLGQDAAGRGICRQKMILDAIERRSGNQSGLTTKRGARNLIQFDWRWTSFPVSENRPRARRQCTCGHFLLSFFSGNVFRESCGFRKTFPGISANQVRQDFSYSLAGILVHLDVQLYVPMRLPVPMCQCTPCVRLAKRFADLSPMDFSIGATHFSKHVSSHDGDPS